MTCDAAVRRALLGEHRQLAAEHLGELLRELDAAGVGRDDDDLVLRQAEVEEVLLEHRQRGHVVDRDAEEALHLARVQVHRQHAIDAGRLEHVGHRGARVIGSRGADFLSWRAYGNHGTTAVMRLAEARRAALIMISSSMRLSLHGREHDWIEEDVGAAHRLVEAHVQSRCSGTS